MVQPHVVHAGDRVQTTQPLTGLPRGSRGTVRQVFPTGDFCEARFDGKLLPRLVQVSALELVPMVLQAREIGD